MDPIRYTLSFTAPHTHYVEVRAEVPTSGRREVELMMAVWTPGSYLIREYERHVENVLRPHRALRWPSRRRPRIAGRLQLPVPTPSL
jgi:predicted metalloprotease with PDZ domain